MKPMRLTVGLALLTVALAGCGSRHGQSWDKAPADPGASRCAALDGVKFGFGTVRAVEHLAAGTELVSLAKRALVKSLVHIDLPPILAPKDLCRVEAELSPVAGSLIKVQVWLPDAWSGKMLAVGGGGFNGGLFAASVSMRPGAAKGFATVVTDVGHDSSESAKFAYDSKEGLVDYAHRGNHATAEFTKELITAYYGRPAKLAYFEGGSNGGREALMEARRYPTDYDGIIAGMPAMSFTKLMTSFAWNSQTVASVPGLATKIAIVGKAVLAKCDALDGVVDGAIGDPPACSFDPATLLCKSGTATGCLSAAEVEALHRLHDGPRLRDGTRLFPGLATGVESHPTELNAWLLGEKPLQPAMSEEAFRWMAHRDPKWNRSQFDLDRDAVASAALAPVLDSDDPDLSAFLKHGGKLILHHGWNDAAIPGANTVAYYQAVLATSGTAAADQVRLFMVPGMGHGLGRPGPEHYDMLSELDRWVEGGAAPDHVVATQYAKPPHPFTGPDASAKVVRTLLLCAWPRLAHHDGTGPVNDQASFSCR